MTFICKPGLADQFQRLLSAELGSAEQLMRVLEREHQLLIQGDADEIRAVSREKQTLVREMTQQLLVRDRFLERLGLPTGNEGAGRFIECADTAAGLQQIWQQIGRLAPQLHDQNEINGGIVAAAQRHVREALNILIDQNEQCPTYGPGGSAAGRSPQSLAKA